MSVKTYTGEEIDVTFDLKRCIHAAACGRHLQQVFDTAKRPWVQPDNASVAEVAATVDLCPSGALKYIRRDGHVGEQAPDINTILVTESGEYQVRGDAQLTTISGDEIAADYRLTLCRCGASKNKPFCDNTHRKIDFQAESSVGADNTAETATMEATGPLKIVTAPDGPLLLQGKFELEEASGERVHRANKAALCRCGASSNKPFCDGTHKEIGFTA